MARINLLPWREQRREERKKRFQLALLGVLLSAVALVVGADRYLNAALSAQQARNAFVREQIVLLDTRIAEMLDDLADMCFNSLNLQRTSSPQHHLGCPHLPMG